MSTISSVGSFYDEQRTTFEIASDEPSQESPTPYMDKKYRRAGAPSDIKDQQGPPKPKTREELILDFIHSEEIFLANTQMCIEDFILPIRNRNSRSWIGGVPAHISRLLDWYEDIVNLHLAIYQSLESSASMQESNCDEAIVAGLATYLSDFVNKLHVYQPYLATLADALEEIAVSVENAKSEFGEFVRIQEGKGRCLEELLMEPVNRLGEYQNLFNVGIHTPFAPE